MTLPPSGAQRNSPPLLVAAALFLAGAALFSLIYCQAPLYYSNQNQYFLHGLARIDDGCLAEDWLANTRDPTPVFSGIVAATAKWLHPWTFHVYHALILGAYAMALLGLFIAVAGQERAKRRWPVFIMLFLLIHSAIARWASYRWLGQDFPWFFQAGVAGQYILGAMFQPSTFGVLLVAAVCLFVQDRPYLAGCCVALAVTYHSTYLAAGAMLTLGFLTGLVLEGRWRKAVGVGTWTFVLVLPVTIYVAVAFLPTSSDDFRLSQDIVANFRLPHHSRPDLWIDPIAALQIAWIAVAIILVPRTRLFWCLAIPFALATLLTLVQIATGSDTMALLFPWRISAVLMPISTTVIFARLATLPWAALDARGWRPVCVMVAAGLAAAGVWIMADRQGFRSNDDELPVLEFVRKTCQPGDVYLIPIRVPDLAKTTRGSLSSDFKPLPDKRADTRVIPPEMQRFRLATGAAIFVDFKSIPYRDVDVLEWYRRIRIAEAIQAQLESGRGSDAVTMMRGHKITHVVVSSSIELNHAALIQVFPGPHYRVYRLGH